MQLSGKVVVVTGASRGIGAATARALGARGATVVGTGRDEAALSSVLKAVGGTALVADARDPGHAEDVVRRAVEAHGRIDAVVVNAGVGDIGSFAEMPATRIDELLDVNVRAPMQLARAALPELSRHGDGALVFVTSIAGLLLVPQESVYSATKAAVEAFAEVLREETRGSGVHVGTVAPGAVQTEFFANRGAPYDRTFPRQIPPEPVAAGVLRVIEDGVDRVVVPGWLRGPALLRRLAPRGYRTLSRRYG
ncbi:MAG: SDR family NAD(P)-dependent oxidoreductase [Frankiaceae bacterium]|nr:SDR family NAD(P)-dependent oxidoreductase [Frankiaceae bacterium]